MLAPGPGDNPFEVLELEPGARPVEIERQKQKLLGMLELGLDAAGTFSTARGERERDAESVRAAAEALAAPASRLAWELWTPRSGEDRDSVDDALELHAAIERHVDEGLAITAGELDELGLAWDLAFESEDLEDRASARASELGVGDVDAVLDAFAEELEESLAAIAGAVRVDLDDVESEILERVADRQTNEMIDRLELSCERYVAGPASLDGWSALCSQYWKVVKGRGDHVRNTAFYALYSPLADHAVDLFHAGDYEAAAREFRWLSERAEAIGDEDAAARERDNAEISANAWLRDEQVANQAIAEPASSGSSWSWLWVVALIVFGLLRAGRSCDRTPSYTPPPIDYDHIDRINRDLQRSLDRIDYSEYSEQLRRHYESNPGGYTSDPYLESPSTSDGQRTNSPPAAVESADP